MRRTAALLALGLAGCAAGGQSPAPRAITVPQPGLLAAPPAPRTDVEAIELAILARDREALELPLSHGSAELRAAAVRGLGLLQRPADASRVVAALADRDPAVRLEAARAAGLVALSWSPLPEGQRRTLEAGCVAALAGAGPERRRALLWSLGRIGGEHAAGALVAALRSKDPALREEAALGLGLVARFHGVEDAGTAAAAAGGLFRDEDVRVRAAAAFALGWLKVPAQDEVLAVLARDPAPEVRAAAARAIGHTARSPSLLEALAGDPEVAVRVEAIRGLQAGAARAAAGRGGRRALTMEAAFEAAQGRTAASLARRLPARDVLQPLLLLLRPPEGFAPHAVAHAAYDALGDPAAAREEVRADVAQLRCHAAAAADAGESKVELVEGCGAGLVPEAVERALLARVLAGVPGAEAVARLEALVRSPEPSVRSAAVEALAKRGEARAHGLLVASLLDRDPAVVATAADVLAADPRPEALDLLLTAWGRFRSEAEAETARALLGALAPLARAHERARALLAGAAADPRPAVRSRARELLAGAALAVEAAAEPAGRQARPLWLPATTAEPGQIVVLETALGRVRIRLDAERAPVAAANFVTLVRGGFYDGVVLHRVEPGFVVQGGDPRGDGFGGPGYAIPCENAPTPYRRGTVGMALAGKDTGGSQFFVTLARSPHLEGRYTSFGEVTEGLERLEQLLPGARIERAFVER